ncbi:MULTISPECIES: ribbon-helix-helix protein, CopG family [Thermodesulfovibrio]|jgi:predicted DNA-binding protein|uniref:ribbon-helix-helix protein, CopG family n=1 Tax=Thermodesulfovibrio TaxID=28261 RepID=UPI002482E1E5|nr:MULTISPECIES: ribbon-helix-helix protein, CopG family [unclassified Thermodesulfovibrio]MDI1471530.1 ribbon-helix-helix protein, CopG family [Thermodesulfovibrio sp. 1176]
MKRKGTNIRMKEEVRNKIFDIAQKSGRTLSEIVREAVEEWLKKREKRERSVK